MEGNHLMQKRTCSPSELRLKQARIALKQKLADLIDYMDTLDRTTWDDLELYALYNTSLQTFDNLYKSRRVIDKEIQDEEIREE